MRGGRLRAWQQSTLLVLLRFSRACVSLSIIPLSPLPPLPVPLPSCWLPLITRAPHPCYVLKICRRIGMISVPPADASPPLPAMFVRPLLVSRFGVVHCSCSLTAVAGDEDAGKEKRNNRKNRKISNVADYRKAGGSCAE
jgi:hypothetical protein